MVNTEDLQKNYIFYEILQNINLVILAVARHQCLRRKIAINARLH